MKQTRPAFRLTEDANLALHLLVGRCPHCSMAGPMFGGSRIYRTGHRSITMQCAICGLQWTMTFHKIAQAAKRWQAARVSDPDDPADRAFDRMDALLVQLDEVVEETRGRDKSTELTRREEAARRPRKRTISR